MIGCTWSSDDIEPGMIFRLRLEAGRRIDTALPLDDAICDASYSILSVACSYIYDHCVTSELRHPKHSRHPHYLVAAFRADTEAQVVGVE
jgi:hypothetical protein